MLSIMKNYLQKLYKAESYQVVFLRTSAISYLLLPQNTRLSKRTQKFYNNRLKSLALRMISPEARDLTSTETLLEIVGIHFRSLERRATLKSIPRWETAKRFERLFRGGIIGYETIELPIILTPSVSNPKATVE